MSNYQQSAISTVNVSEHTLYTREELAQQDENLAKILDEYPGLLDIPSELFLLRGCYDTDCTGGCG